LSRTSYRRATRSRVVLAALLAASVTVVTLDFRQGNNGPLRKVQDEVLTILAPLQAGVSSALSPVGRIFRSIGDIPHLQSQNAKLRAQVSALKDQQNQVPEMQRQLNDALGLLQEQPWTAGHKLGASVISEGPSNAEWTVFLDKGASSGVAVGMAVVAQAGLVGRVTAVSPGSSKVLLAIDPQHAVGSRLTGSGDTGVVSGKGQSDLSFDLIGVTTTVTPGETVVTSGYDGGIYPPGIPIGRVKAARRSPDGLNQTASVQPFVDFNKLSLVLILLDTRPVKLPGQ
jgi:rod shape-determining protein MreC